VILLHVNGGIHNDTLGLGNIKSPYKKWIHLAAENDIVLIVPNAIDGTNNRRGWNGCRDDARGNYDLDDVSFITNLKIRPTRIMILT